MKIQGNRPLSSTSNTGTAWHLFKKKTTTAREILQKILGIWEAPPNWVLGTEFQGTAPFHSVPKVGFTVYIETLRKPIL